MDRVQLIWGVFPSAVAVAVIVFSVYSIWRGFGLLQLVLGMPTIAICLGALIVLRHILVDRAWPTYLPHIGIAIAVLLVTVQVLLTERARKHG